MRTFATFLFVLVGSLLLVSLAQAQTDRSAAQERRGAIAGKVTDTAGGILQGAKITVEPGPMEAVSDAQGQFLVSGLAPGVYTVTISYVGFSTLTKNVNVLPTQVANTNAQLAVASQNLEVLVTADRASGEAEEVNRERNADNIVQVLTSDVIRSLPNANMADALGRLPSVTIERDEGEGKYVQVRGTEPRLTNTTIDGINVPSPESGVRQIKFDAIPADIVESVEIDKTLQANMDGDGIGGSVNLVTKTAGERPTMNFSSMGGYTPILGGRGLTENTSTMGKRFGTSKRFGLLFGGSYDWNGRGIDDTEPVPDIATFSNGTQARYFEGADIREYRYYRSRWGVAGSADYKIADGSSIYTRFLYSDFHNYGDRWVYSLTDNTQGISLQGSNGCATTTNASGQTVTTAPCTGVPSFNDQIRRPDYAIGSLLLGGKHVLSTTWYSWDVSASRSRQIGEVGDRTASFTSGLSSSSCQYDLANTTSLYLPQWTPSCFVEAYQQQSNFPLTRMQINNGLTAQLNLQVTGAMAKRYRLGSRLATIEIGSKFRNGHKFANTSTDNYFPMGSGAPIELGSFRNSFSNSDYYQGAYRLGPNPSFHDVYSAFLASGAPSSCTNNANYTCTPDISSQFDLIEQVGAGYVMNTVDFTKVRLVAGIRFENTNLSTAAPTFGNCDPTQPNNSVFCGLSTNNGSYLKVLPSASLRFALGKNTYLRTVYSRGVSRPDPQDIAQAVSYTFIAPNDPRNSVSLGNPNLRAEMSDNVDILIEHYINPFGMVTAGYFYKNLTDPVVLHTSIIANYQPPAPGAPPGSYTVTQPFNAGSAWINGFEAAYLQHLSFMPGILKGLGFSANYSYTASRIAFGPDFNRPDHPRLLRNAPNTWNISPTYDGGRISARVGLSYNEANIAGYGNGPIGPFGDNYFYSHLQFDAQGSVRLMNGLQFVMYGLNINNGVFGFYSGSPQYMVQREYYRPTIAAGFRWTPLHER